MNDYGLICAHDLREKNKGQSHGHDHMFETAKQYVCHVLWYLIYLTIFIFIHSNLEKLCSLTLLLNVFRGKAV